MLTAIFPTLEPRQTATRQRAMLSSIYKNAGRKRAFTIISKSSYEKVLKVVSPPQRPTVKATFRTGLITIFSIQRA